MRKLKITDITSSAAMPVKSGSLEHIQLAAQEAISASLKCLLDSEYDPTVGYVLYGCENSGSGTTYTISEGAIFYNDEVFLVPSASLTTSGSNVVVAQIVTTSYTGNGVNADPVNFTNGVPYNVHEIRKINFVLGLSGSQEFNYSNTIFVHKRIKGILGEIKMWAPPSGTISDYFNTSTGLSNNPITQGWALANGSNGTYNMNGRVPVGYNPSDGDFNTLAGTGGEKTHTLIINEIPAHYHIQGSESLYSDYGGGSLVTGQRTYPDGTHDSYRNAHTSTVGGDAAHNNLQPFKTVLFIQRIS
jgi:hypothetical protein